MGLRLADYSDRELLLVIRDVADARGHVTTPDIAKAIGVSNEKRGNQMVGARLGYMVRTGAVEKVQEAGPTRWRLSKIGLTLASGSMTAAQGRLLAHADAGTLLLVTRTLAKRTQDGTATESTLAWREFRRSTGRR